jgi:sugar phosphate isomerase/epimerase
VYANWPRLAAGITHPEHEDEMKIAAQEGLAPGETFAQKLANLAAYGFDGVELHGRELRRRLPEVKAALAESPLKASTICGGFPAQFTMAEKEKRQESVVAVRDLLRCAAEVGAAGVIFVPRFNRDPGVPDLSPLYTVDRLQRDLLVAVIRPLAREAADLGVSLILEPLNRYEARFPADLAEGCAICEEVDSPGLRLMGDFFHMSIEEADIAASLRRAATYLRHIHLADSNRVVPGRGHTQFVEPFGALREIGFDGFGALECRVPEPREASLRETAQFLRQQLSAAGW